MFSKIALAAAVGLSIFFVSGCSAPEVVLSVRTEPPGAAVYLSRRGQRAYYGAFGPIRGDMQSEPYEEDFMLVGRTPLEFASPLEEEESGGAALLGIGVTRVRRYEQGVLRFEKRGYEPVEQRVLFEEGQRLIDVELHRVEAPPSSPDDGHVAE